MRAGARTEIPYDDCPERKKRFRAREELHATMPPTKQDTARKWERAYVDALDSDQWGQMDEAGEAYEHLASMLQTQYTTNRLGLTPKELTSLERLIITLQLRIQGMHKRSSPIKLEDMQNIKPWMSQFLRGDDPFPVALPATHAHVRVSVDGDVDAKAKAKAAEPLPPQEDRAPRGGKLLPELTQLRHGDKALSFRIEKWGFKEPKYTDPYILITLVGPNGSVIGAQQETPIVNNQQGQYYFFNTTVHIQKPINDLKPGSALFFEFMHFKAKRDENSCKAFCLIEHDELMALQEGKCALEVYAKPADYSRKSKPRLLSVKPLYLHLVTHVNVG